MSAKDSSSIKLQLSVSKTGSKKTHNDGKVCIDPKCKRIKHKYPSTTDYKLMYTSGFYTPDTLTIEDLYTSGFSSFTYKQLIK